MTCSSETTRSTTCKKRSISCSSRLTSEKKLKDQEEELKRRDALIESLDEQNRMLRTRFNRLKGVFGEHRSSRTEGLLKSSKLSLLEPSKQAEHELKKTKSRVHRMSNIEEVVSKKDSIFNL